MAMFGTGPAKALDKWAIPRVAQSNGWHPAALEAIKKAESGGFGWFRDGRCKMLPEPHWFLRKLSPAKRKEAMRLGLATTTTFQATKNSGHYRKMGNGPEARYALFAKWRSFDEAAAFAACSWGTYQIMGFNHKLCGYVSAKAMVTDFFKGEQEQLNAFVAFLLKKNLKVAIRKLDFEQVARKYNGSGQVKYYSKIITKHYYKLKLGKWKNWNPKSDIPKPTPTKPVKDPADVPTQVGTGGAVILLPGAVAVFGFTWAQVLAAFAGGALAGVGAWFLYKYIKDREDPEKTRVAQPDDLEEVPA